MNGRLTDSSKGDTAARPKAANASNNYMHHE